MQPELDRLLPKLEASSRSAQVVDHQSRSSGSAKHQADAVEVTEPNPACRPAAQPAAGVGLTAVAAGDLW